LVKPQQTSLDRGLRLLALIQERGELRLVQLIEELGSSRATVFRALATLQAHGFVEHDRASRVYRLGPALRPGQSPAIVQLAIPILHELVELTGETAGLIVVHGRRLRYAAVVDGTFAVRFQASTGDEVPAHASAGGKAVLASLTSAQRDGFLGPEPYPGYTQRTIVRRAPLEWDLESVRERGYAVDDQETELGTRGVAAAILGLRHRPIGAVIVIAPSTRLTPADAPTLGRTIADHCAGIAGQLPKG
jgi:IclR family transcriptional regulator, acetate operon repressor